MAGKRKAAPVERRETGIFGIDREKLQSIGALLLKLVFAGILIKFAIDVILVQHEFFS